MVGSFAIKSFYELKYLRMSQPCIETALPAPAPRSFFELNQGSRSWGLKMKLANILPVQYQQQEPWPWTTFKETCEGDGVILMLFSPVYFFEYCSFSL